MKPRKAAFYTCKKDFTAKIGARKFDIKANEQLYLSEYEANNRLFENVIDFPITDIFEDPNVQLAFFYGMMLMFILSMMFE